MQQTLLAFTLPEDRYPAGHIPKVWQHHGSVCVGVAGVAGGAGGVGGDTLPSPPTPGTPGTPGIGLTGGVAGAGLVETPGPSPMTDPAGTSPVTMLFFLPALSTWMLVSLT